MNYSEFMQREQRKQEFWSAAWHIVKALVFMALGAGLYAYLKG